MNIIYFTFNVLRVLAFLECLISLIFFQTIEMKLNNNNNNNVENHETFVAISQMIFDMKIWAL